MATNYTLSPSPWLTFLHADGSPVAAGQLFTYQAGTTTPATTYSTSSGTPNTNPIILDSAGRATIFLSPGSYRYDLYDSVASGGALLKTQDNISAIPLTAAQTAVAGLAGEQLNSGSVVYLSAGDGGRIAGRWYNAKADNAYSSTTPQIGFIGDAIASGTSGNIILVGELATGIAVTAGFDYYIDPAVAGGITSTVPSNARYVGQADSGTSIVFTADPRPPVALASTAVCDLRLSLTTGVPVTPTDVTAATVVYAMPYKGNRIALYNGTGWNTRILAQVSIAVPATTASIYDVFIFDNSGTPAIELSAAWTSDVAIFGAGIYATARPTQDGVYVKSTNGTAIDATRRWVGTFRTTGSSGQTEDSAAKRYLSNYYNPVPRMMRVLEATATWGYSVATWRQARANVANQLDFVLGYPSVTVKAHVQGNVANDGGGVNGFVGVGFDSTTAPVAGALLSGQGGWAAGETAPVSSSVILTPAIGRHTLVWLEFATATGNTTWTGVSGTTFQSGIEGELSGA